MATVNFLVNNHGVGSSQTATLMYDSTMPLQGYEDWDFWIVATKADWKFHHLGEIVFDYGVPTNSCNAEYRRTKTPKSIRKYLYSKPADFFHENYKRVHSNSIVLKHYRADPVQASLRFLSKSLASKLVPKGE